jgi:hypothetical protein
LLKVCIPIQNQVAREWIVDFVFNTVLGLDIEIAVHSISGYCVILNGKQISLPDVFFANSSFRWLKPESIPKPPLAQWVNQDSGLHSPFVTEALPILFGEPGIEIFTNHIRCNVDIFGSIFFMLSRYEELALPDRDVHDRFPAHSSLAYKAGFLYRPVVDEYVELLWGMMGQLWPQLGRKPRQGQVFVSCDVDHPFNCGTSNVSKLIRSLGADLLKRRDAMLAYRRARNVFARRRGDYRFDPIYTFDWYIDTCERYGCKATFFFIAGHSAEDIHRCYEVTEPRIQALIRKLSHRGHEVGLHGSYYTYQDSAQISRERQCMIAACEQAGVDASISGNRQHYLRWDTAQTPDHLDSAGFEYDTTGSFAETPGFRYGTSRTFNMWSWKRNAPLKIKQRPLVVMEDSVISEQYLGLEYTDKALNLMLMLKERSLRYGGDFTLLWHNSHLLTDKDREFFKTLIMSATLG